MDWADGLATELYGGSKISIATALRKAKADGMREAVQHVETMPHMSAGIPKGGFQREAFEMVEYTLKNLAERIRAAAQHTEGK